MKRRFFIFFWGLFALLALAGCTDSGRLWLKSPDWSRAVPVGESGVAFPVALQVRADGAACALLLPVDEGETRRYHLQLSCLLPDGRLQRQDYPFTLRLPQGADFRWGEAGVELWWLDDKTLYTARVPSPAGETMPQSVLDDVSLGNFILLDEGILAAGTQRAPGIYALDAAGQLHVLAEDGVWVRAAHDADGNLHLAWVTYPVGYGRSALYYAFRPAAAGWEALTVQEVTALPLGLSTRLDSLALGVDDTHVSIVWTVSVVSGLEAGSMTSYYVSKALTEAHFLSAEVLAAPLAYDLPFVPAEPEGLRTGKRQDLTAAPFAYTPALEDFSVLDGGYAEIAMAYRASMLHQWRKYRWQVNVLYFDEGQPHWAQPLSFTPSYSLSPQLAADADGYLYLAWLEKIAPRAYSVYLTSTHPAVVQAQGALTWAERGNILLQVAFGMLVGALLAPLAAAVWMLGALFVYLLVNALRRWLPLAWRERWEYLALALALFVFWGGKQAVLPAMFTYVPFSAWVPGIPLWLQPVLRYGVPALILALSLGVAWHYTYRQKNRAGLYFLLIYIACDSLLSMAVYAVMIYGVF